MEDISRIREFYSDKTVLLTGVHGFKGAWLASLLLELGVAKLIALGLPSQNKGLFTLMELNESGAVLIEQDIRDHQAMIAIFQEVQPDIVFHLAAQAIVSTGYQDPHLTFSSNLMGTVNVLEGIRSLDRKVSVVMVTSDKAYFNAEKSHGYTEEDILLGSDPYSASKSGAEQIIFSFNKSYFNATLESNSPKIVSPCRAGNVVGGGDFSIDRLVCDMVRALENGTEVAIRSFRAIRPYEHVLDAVFAYVLLAYHQWKDPTCSGAYNIGPNDSSIMSNGEVITYFQNHSPLRVNDVSDHSNFHETTLLKLNSEKFRSAFDWKPKWGSKQDILSRTLDWYNKYLDGNADMQAFTQEQIREFLND